MISSRQHGIQPLHLTMAASWMVTKQHLRSPIDNPKSSIGPPQPPEPSIRMSQGTIITRPVVMLVWATMISVMFLVSPTALCGACSELESLYRMMIRQGLLLTCEMAGFKQRSDDWIVSIC
jgi:hypothetical protein